MGDAPKFLVMEAIEIESGVNEAGEPFCKLRVIAEGGLTIILGQSDVATMREQAMHFLECAEGAAQDAAVLRVMRMIGMEPVQSDQMAGLVIRELRKMRADGGS